MATVTTVTLIVAFAPVLCGLAQTVVAPLVGDCSGSNTGTQVVDVKAPKTTFTLKCKDGDAEKVKPAFAAASDFRVCPKKDCDTDELLSTYITGATGAKETKTKATVTINALPPAEKTFYVRCGETSSNPCYIEVKVAAAKSESGGVTEGGPLSCATTGKAITIKIPEKGSTAQFTCGKLILYPRAPDRVFAEDCKKEENLKDIVRSAQGDVYTLTAGKKPPKKRWCYLCAESSVTSNQPGQASDYCLVHVESRSRTQSDSAIALPAMLACVLALLRMT